MNYRYLVLLPGLLTAVGCVSSSKYQMKEKEAAGLAADRAKLESERNALQQQVVDLQKEKENLAQTKTEEIQQVKGTYDQLVEDLKGEIQSGQIKVTQLKDRLSVNMVDKILFSSGSSTLKATGEAVLGRISKILKDVKDKDIRVEGHTDNVPIGGALKQRYPTNWELSTARATNMVRFLQEKGGIDPRRLIAAGYSEFHPVAPNDSEPNRSQNRRLEIVLVPSEGAVSPDSK